MSVAVLVVMVGVAVGQVAEPARPNSANAPAEVEKAKRGDDRADKRSWSVAPGDVPAQGPSPLAPLPRGEGKRQAEVEEEPREDEAQVAEGLWPSPKLMRLMLQRWVEEACDEYELDAEQRAAVKEEAIERWSEFLTENRAQLQPLVNEFLEMRMDLTPPPSERVKEWAERAEPVFEKTRQQVGESHDEFRKVLRPMQRAKFEVDALKMNAGMAIAEQKLAQWKRGEVDNDVFWEARSADRRSRREERRRRREEREAAEAQATAETPVDQIAAELGRWDKYVADFITGFRLDEGQRTAALSCLSELKERAIAHRDHRREDVAKLEQQIESFTGSPSTLEELKKQLAELYGPIDEMFKELKSRLEVIPTTQQRAEAQADTDKQSLSVPPGEEKNEGTVKPE